MSSKTYSELLKRPEWKARRLEILARDKNVCRCCKSVKNLQVHHLKYLKNSNPWESPDDDLITLCESCHSVAHGIDPKPRNIPYDRTYHVYAETVHTITTKISSTALSVLLGLMDFASYNHIVVVMSADKYSTLESKLKISTDTIVEIIKALKRKKIIATRGSDIFINPYYAWFGNYMVRQDILDSEMFQDIFKQ